VEITSADKVRKIVDCMSGEYYVTDVQITPPRSGTTGYVGIEANVHPTPGSYPTPAEVAEKMEKLDDVIFALESI
jgi:hypothetical protein